jgi:hypothetical protein
MGGWGFVGGWRLWVRSRGNMEEGGRGDLLVKMEVGA